MSFAIRDNQPLVLHIDTDVLRAVVGVGELFSRPSVVSFYESSIAQHLLSGCMTADGS